MPAAVKGKRNPGHLTGSQSRMLYDEALQTIGGFGRYQGLVLACAALASASTAMSVYAFVFVISTGNDMCKDPGADDFNSTSTYVQNLTSPTEQDYSKCTVYGEQLNQTGVSDTASLLERKNSTIETGCKSDWILQRANSETTITMQWDLICHREYLAGLTQTLYMAGMMVGVITSGILADRFGRFKTIALFQIIFTTVTIVVPFSADVTMFSALRFLTGVASVSSSVTMLILCIEIVAPDKRAAIVCVRAVSWMSGMLLTVGAAYVWRHWKTFMIVVSTPTILGAISLVFIPESPRWLYTKGKYKEGDAVMAKFAKWNGYPELQSAVETTKMKREDIGDRTGAPQLIFKYPKLFCRIILMAFIWFAVVLNFFGLTFNSMSLGNRYLNFAISAASELPSYLFVWVFLDRLGGRNLTGVPLLVAGSVLLLIMAVPSRSGMSWLLIAMSNIGKVCASVTFTAIVPYTAELFPTVIRNTAVGFVSSFGRIGSLIAPQLALLAMHNKNVPLAVFGTLSLLAGAATFLLPQTTGLPLPETLEDGEMVGQQRKRTHGDVDQENEENIPALVLNTEEC